MAHVAPNRNECDVRTLMSLISDGLDGTLVDVREYPEFAAGHVPGSLHIPAGQIRHRAGEIDPFGPIYLICRTGRRSGEVSAVLPEFGFTDVRNVAGGMVAWELIGGELERDSDPPWAMERQVRLAAGLLVLTGVLLGVFVSPYFYGLSGLIGGGLAFSAMTNTCTMASILGRMPWNRPRVAASTRTGTSKANTVR